MDSVRWLTAGASAGLAVDLSLYPLDTLKTRLQSQQGFHAAGGFRHVYRGMGSVALGSAPSSALFFVTYSSMKGFMFKQDSVWCDALRASCGEFAACLVRVPTEVVKQRAQVTSGASIARISRELWRSNGILTFYRGFSSTLIREIPFAFIEYPLWEYLKRKVTDNSNHPISPLKSALCGSVAGSIAAGLTTPLDVTKTRIMLGSGSSKSTLSVLLEIANSEGWKALFAGVTPRCLWMGTGGCIYFFAYEYVLWNRFTGLVFQLQVILMLVQRYRVQCFAGWLNVGQELGAWCSIRRRQPGDYASICSSCVSFSNVFVTFKTSKGDHTVEAEVGDSLLDTVINHNVPIDGFGACEGSLDCSTCHVVLAKEHYNRLVEPSVNEMDLLDAVPQLQETSRLGCQVVLTKADKPSIVVAVPSERNDVRTSI